MRATCEQVGTTMMVCWILLIGPLGAVLLLGAAYAMTVGNLALAITCAGLLLFPSLVFTGVWGVTTLAAIMTERLAQSPDIPIPRSAQTEAS